MTQAAALAAYGSQGVSLGFKNRIINGDMRIDQRNNGASVNISSTGNTFVTDRWMQTSPQASKLVVQRQSSTPPAGFGYYTRVGVATAYTPTGSESFTFRQIIEGNNVLDLAWGTSSAKPITLSFWVRSSLTGTFGGSIIVGATTPGTQAFSYTINAANTWEYKTVTMSGPTSGVVMQTDYGIYVQFSMGAAGSPLGTPGTWSTSALYYGATGQVNMIATAGATWDITGVQFEVGTSATPFEFRDYTREFQMCQRYYFKMTPGSGPNYGVGFAGSSSNFFSHVVFPVTMRIPPTSMDTTGTAADYATLNASTNTALSSVPTIDDRSAYAARVNAVSSSLTAGAGGYLRSNSSASFLGFNAEL